MISNRKMATNLNLVKFQFDNNNNISKGSHKITDHELLEDEGGAASVVAELAGHVTNGGIVCSYCSESGHMIRGCPKAVVSFGLICYYNKQITVTDNNLNSNFFNKRTRKNGAVAFGGYGGHRFIRGYGYHNLPKIKILKRNESLSHTLKNMLGITSADNDLDNYRNLEDDNQDENADNEECDENENFQERETESGNHEKVITTQKVILVQRRNTIGFIEFMRGKYELGEHDYIIKLFNMMTFDEKRILREYDSFDTIRKIIGLGRENIYKREYDESKVKFEGLRNHEDGNLIYKLLDKSITRWNSPEWGLPKGRRRVWSHGAIIGSSDGWNKDREIDIECAIREFVEETGIKYKNLMVYRNVKPLEEVYKGINGVLYKHVYYLAEVKNIDDARVNIETVERGGQQNFEVSNVKCFGLSECHRIIRPYYISKLNAIKKGFQLINSINQYFE